MKKRKRSYCINLFFQLIIIGSVFPSLYSHAKGDKFDPLTIFTDPSCSELKAGITAKNIAKISDVLYKDIATRLSTGRYEDKEFRIQSYRPYQTPKISAARTKTMHTWGVLDNVTGIYVENPEDELCILVGETHGQEVKLRVQDYSKGWETNTVTLKTGMNKVKPGSGLCYIMIFQDEYIPLNPETDVEKREIQSKNVKIHFATGKVNGYYDIAKNKGEDSGCLLSKAKYPYFDVKGKYSQLAWYTEDFQEAGTNLSKTIERLDQLVGLEIDFSGLFKYGKSFSTRMFFMPSTNGGGNPNATVERVIFPRVYKNFFANPDSDTFMKRIWGLAHEVGHCSQSNPGMRWGGMGEVGNNIFSMYVKTQLYGYEKSNMLAEGYYEKAKALIIDKNLAHADMSIITRHFERLVPFWQLHLYTAEVKGYKDLYRDLYEHYRTTLNVGTTFENSGALQLDFVRNVCHLSKTNLIDFFRKWGFLTPVNVVINDYGKRTLKITQQEIDALVVEIESKNYEKPVKDITSIRDDNFFQFR
ncbi:hypothetical protein GGR21_000127 [Dysgonomonas hofstadii]|uniref:Peptidase M60 domain-containing protein n=1 Tax=Dysgonomonas hofstadii TaxID=637886 RepID=A0A840CNU2_9BACT|nr:M60 family metallopeptidase [Dysgonomonas hofstadii]MBB4034242.1 hypothetical protein [Dysgonomonas hofstadii]